MSGQVFLSCAEVAGLLGVAVQTIYNWRTQGRFDVPSYRIGGLVKYKSTDVEQWIATRAA